MSLLKQSLKVMAAEMAAVLVREGAKRLERKLRQSQKAKSKPPPRGSK